MRGVLRESKESILKRIAVLFAAALLVGCEKPVEAEGQVAGTNPELVVEVIATFDGYRIIRFRDAGYRRYAVLPAGTVTWTESCGKNCVRGVSVQTADPK